MGSLNSLFPKESNIKLGKIVQRKSSGLYKIRINNVVHTAIHTKNQEFAVGDTVLLNKADTNNYYIVGRTDGLANVTNIQEVVRDG